MGHGEVQRKNLTIFGLSLLIAVSANLALVAALFESQRPGTVPVWGLISCMLFLVGTVAGSARFVSKNFDGQESVKLLGYASFLLMIALWLVAEVTWF